ncbi:hypothetical protein SCP_0301200 [Sparassis crispa]|uniref:Uncharacterized protein n=1 Tax=Sparassis crispa TaxID=139825 RepID=A0A401GE57_9APHY|nr:hypothetical protein SCP_0301200 [Sparassis crispa]GBE80405.1 hypothetical protein SCP_0301200 [Sparassis crispa]
MPWKKFSEAQPLADFISPDMLPADCVIIDPSKMTQNQVEALLNHWRVSEIAHEMEEMMQFLKCWNKKGIAILAKYDPLPPLEPFVEDDHQGNVKKAGSSDSHKRNVDKMAKAKAKAKKGGGGGGSGGASGSRKAHKTHSCEESEEAQSSDDDKGDMPEPPYQNTSEDEPVGREHSPVPTNNDLVKELAGKVPAAVGTLFEPHIHLRRQVFLHSLCAEQRYLKMVNIMQRTFNVSFTLGTAHFH